MIVIKHHVPPTGRSSSPLQLPPNDDDELEPNDDKLPDVDVSSNKSYPSPSYHDSCNSSNVEAPYEEAYEVCVLGT